MFCCQVYCVLANQPFYHTPCMSLLQKRTPLHRYSCSPPPPMGPTGTARCRHAFRRHCSQLSRCCLRRWRPQWWFKRARMAGRQRETHGAFRSCRHQTARRSFVLSDPTYPQQELTLLPWSSRRQPIGESATRHLKREACSATADGWAFKFYKAPKIYYIGSKC